MKINLNIINLIAIIALSICFIIYAENNIDKNIIKVDQIETKEELITEDQIRKLFEFQSKLLDVALGNKNDIDVLFNQIDDNLDLININSTLIKNNSDNLSIIGDIIKKDK